MAKADLHVHSKHSNRPTEWLLRQANAPESFTEPLEVYRRCRERGMDFVTLSDHDTVAGALEIAHLPGVFLSSEVTVAFPDDDCHIHCLVTGVSEAQHGEIQRLRGNLYEFRDYLVTEGIVHSVAHPLVRVNGRLTLAQLEKLLVLFNRFEGRNGIHDQRANETLTRIAQSLTREVIEDLAERHRLRPQGPMPWLKSLTGGSDDHGGFFIATTYTETPEAASVAEYLRHLAAGAHVPGGQTGSTLRLTQSLYAIGYEFYRRTFLPVVADRKDPFARLLKALATPQGAPGEAPRRRLFSFLSGKRKLTATCVADHATFGFASRASREALADLGRDFVRQVKRGRLAGCLGSAANLAPFALTLSPFLVALHAQHRDRDLVDAAAETFLGSREAGVEDRTAWFTADPAAELPEALRALAASGRGGVVALTCGEGAAPAGIAVERFAPLTELSLGLAEPVRIPPVLDILEHLERGRYAEILVTTPGPLAPLAVAAAKLLGLRLTGIFSANLPREVRTATGSDSLAEAASLYLRWLTGQMDHVRWLGGTFPARVAEPVVSTQGAFRTPLSSVA